YGGSCDYVIGRGYLNSSCRRNVFINRDYALFKRVYGILLGYGNLVDSFIIYFDDLASCRAQILVNVCTWLLGDGFPIGNVYNEYTAIVQSIGVIFSAIYFLWYGVDCCSCLSCSNGWIPTSYL